MKNTSERAVDWNNPSMAVVMLTAVALIIAAIAIGLLGSRTGSAQEAETGSITIIKQSRGDVGTFDFDVRSNDTTVAEISVTTTPVLNYETWGFGYGRATDHACKDIRAGRMTRDEGIAMAEIDFSLLRSIRKQVPSLANRRPSAYRERGAVLS